MKHLLILLIFLSIGLTIEAKGPFLSSNINKDSLLLSLVDSLPKKIKKSFIREFKKGNVATKEFMLFMLSMPTSSKKELIENWEARQQSILELKAKYAKLVPMGHVVDVEFDPGNRLWNIEPSITIRITFPKKDNNTDSTLIKRDMLIDSNELKEFLKIVDWDESTLKLIKGLLDKSNCVSIANGDSSTSIGFKRSGMGKYYYLVFNSNLDADEQATFTDGCSNIFYKENVVLQHFGGAIGPQCFPDN